MDRRLELDAAFRAICDHVYYQPPENLQLAYPCIVYELEQINTLYANNKPFVLLDRFSATVIDRDPESTITRQIAEFPKCRHTQHFVNDNLHHDVFMIY